MRTLSLAMATIWLVAAALAVAAEGERTSPDRLKSLAGAAPIEKAPAPDQLRPDKDQAPLPRDFVQQPPLIPHSIRGYQITKNFNQCMDCHAWSRYKETGATKLSVAHFKDQHNQELANLAPRRYFCTQCHVPQTDARPLVSNTFKPATGLQPK